MSLSPTRQTKRLNGRGVLVTRPLHQAEQLCQAIAAEGGLAIRCPTIGIAEPTDEAPTAHIFAQLHTYDWAIFTSQNAVTRAWARLAQWPITVQVAAIGKATAKALQQRGIATVITAPPPFDSEALLQILEPMGDWQRQSVVLIKGEGGRDHLAQTLKTWGAKVVSASVYRRICPDTDMTELIARWQRGEIHAVILTSAESLINLRTLLGTHHTLLQHTPLVVASMRIQRLAIAYGYPQVGVAEVSDETSWVEALGQLDGVPCRSSKV